MANSCVKTSCAIFSICLALTGCSSEENSPDTGVADTANVSRPAQSTAPAAPDVSATASEAEPVVEAAPVSTPTTEGAPATVVATEEPTESSANTPQQHVVTGVVTQWRPMVLFVQPGDQIVFKQMAGHDTATVDGMIPEGGTAWQSKLGQEGFAVTIDVPGVYVYKCTPHVSLGMLGAIVVGDLPPGNLQQIKDHPQNKGMIGRAIRKLGQALDAKAGG